VELAAFITDQRPPPARLLEVGSGDGTLARALAHEGYEVTAIDPAAPPGEEFRRIKLEDLEESEEYDLVVAASSLHHITDLDGALDKLVRLLRGRGAIVVDEFAWDRLDLATAAWFHGQRRVAASVDECRRDWEHEHVGLHGYDALRVGLDARFDERHFEWRPYLHRLLHGAASEAEERALIEAGSIQALGFRYAGTPRG
jgi:SAM-dependent methyltransferase